MTIAIFLLFVLLAPPFSQRENAQTASKLEWSQLEYFVGSWRGSESGVWGSAKCQRQYNWDLGRTFLELRNKNVFPRQPKNPKGEVHEDHGMISYDTARAKFVLRQFHVEGFVNQYVLTASADRKTLTWESESVENNVASAWRVRETYKIVNKNEFVDTFELAAPGKEFVVACEGTYRRIRGR